MLEAVTRGPRFTISLKRSTQNLHLSTSGSADYPIFSGAASQVFDHGWQFGQTYPMPNISYLPIYRIPKGLNVSAYRMGLGFVQQLHQLPLKLP
jgi:hypothetical protein